MLVGTCKRSQRLRPLHRTTCFPKISLHWRHYRGIRSWADSAAENNYPDYPALSFGLWACENPLNCAVQIRGAQAKGLCILKKREIVSYCVLSWCCRAIPLGSAKGPEGGFPMLFRRRKFPPLICLPLLRPELLVLWLEFPMYGNDLIPEFLRLQSGLQSFAL